MSNQACKARPESINVNRNNAVSYPFSIETSKCRGNYNNISDPYVKICVPDVVKDLNVKVFYLISRTNQTRHIKWPKTCRCMCRLDAIVCNNKQCEYLDYENSKCKKWLVYKLVDECKKNIDEVKIVGESKNKCNSCILHIVLFSIFFTINVVSKYDYVYQTENY